MPRPGQADGAERLPARRLQVSVGRGPARRRPGGDRQAAAAVLTWRCREFRLRSAVCPPRPPWDRPGAPDVSGLRTKPAAVGEESFLLASSPQVPSGPPDERQPVKTSFTVPVSAFSLRGRSGVPRGRCSPALGLGREQHPGCPWKRDRRW